MSPARPQTLFRVAVIAVGLLLGVAAGVGGFTFWYARGAAYLTNDPRACANCHVMRDQFEAWRRSSHHAVAVCNDCHAPHSTIPKLWVKAKNGFHHSTAFTTGRFPEPIRIGPANRAVTEAQCRYCHGDIAAAIDTKHDGGRTPCIRCHSSVGHLSLE